MESKSTYPRWLAREERKAARRPTHLGGSVAGSRIVDQEVEIMDISPLGCRLRVTDPISVGSYLTLAGESAPRLTGWVAWSRARECGLDFARPLPEVVVERIALAAKHPQASRALS